MNPADIYETYYVPGMFRPLSRALLPAAAVKEGERVLDLACGTGIIARQIAPVVGADGRVVALDLRPGMIDVASKLTVPYGAPIEWTQGDATKLQFADGSFDVVVCQQGLQFFPDRPAAVAEMKRVLAPGGRVALALWEPLEKQSLWHDVISVELRHFHVLGLPAADAVTPFSLNDAGEVRALLETAGLRDVTITSKTIEADFPADGLVDISTKAYAAVMPQIANDPAAFARFTDAVVRETDDIVKRYARDGRARFPMQSLIVSAHV
ncbi:MAG TPA: methyltransferase domain-containing protein [Kofleriaceae bacterium]|nr:methyltransferase domain-containing protein [Kofleriaceae bacterium]